MATTTKPEVNLRDRTDRYLTSVEVEAYTDGALRAASLKIWRCQGSGASVRIPYIKISNRVFYRASVIDEFIANATIAVTARDDA